MISPKTDSVHSLHNPLFLEHALDLSIGPMKCQNNYILNNTVSQNTCNNTMIECVHSYLTHRLVQANTMHSATLCASLCSFASPRGLSHRLQLSMSCSSMGPSHRAYSFRNRLLQSQILPANLFQHRPPWRASPWCSLRAPGNLLLQLNHLLSLLPHWPGCLQGCLSLSFPTLPQLLQNTFSIFLDTFPERHQRSPSLRVWAVPGGGCFGSGGNAVPGTGSPGLFPMAALRARACPQHLPLHPGGQNLRGKDRAVRCPSAARHGEFPQPGLKPVFRTGK